VAAAGLVAAGAASTVPAVNVVDEVSSTSGPFPLISLL
jgi:hypothetical protein